MRTKKKNEIKTDRRVAFTKTSIKDTLLEEIKQRPFEEIGIVKLCEKAQISRSAFYLHFSNLNEVLEEIVMDAVEENHGVIKIILGDYVGSECKNCKSLATEKYIGLFSDKTASGRLIKYLIDNYKSEYIKNVVKKHDISRFNAEVLFYFQTTGIIAAATEMSSRAPGRWKKLGEFRDKLFEKGLEGIVK